jgi:hypothetical protein
MGDGCLDGRFRVGDGGQMREKDGVEFDFDTEVHQWNTTGLNTVLGDITECREVDKRQ